MYENREQEEALEQYKLAVEVCLMAPVVDCPLGQNRLACICVRPTICRDTLVVHCIRCEGNMRTGSGVDEGGMSHLESCIVYRQAGMDSSPLPSYISSNTFQIEYA